MAAVTLTVIGCGDAFGTGGRFQPCFLLEHPGGRALIDCGASSLVALRARGVDPASIDTVVVSHLHGDHFGGLPFLIIDALYGTPRTTPLRIAGPRGTEARVRGALDLFYPGAGVKLVERPLVTFVELEAPGPTAIGALGVAALTVVHASGAPAYALRIAVAGRIVAYSGDTAWTDVLLQAADGADLFLCECSSFDRAIPMHISHGDLAGRRDRFNVRRMVLVHLGGDMLAHAHASAFELAHDGLVIDI